MLREPLAAYGLDDNRIADVAIRQEEIIEANKITDWTTNLDVQKNIKRQLDNHFYDVERASGATFDLAQLDVMIDQVVEIAKARDSRTP